MEPQTGTIYQLRSRTSRKSYYGQTINTPEYRYVQHVKEARLTPDSGCRHLNAAINLYGADDFEIITIGVYPVEELDAREIAIIAENDAMNTGYNLTAGGGGFRGKMPEAFNEKQSETMRRHYLDWELGRCVCYWKNGSVEGFLVKIPGKATKYFTDSHMTMEEKAELAKAYRDHVKAGGAEKPQRAKKANLPYKLPPYVYYKSTQDGFSVEYPNSKKKSCVTKGQLEENLFRAMEYYLTLVTIEDGDRYTTAYDLFNELKVKLKK